MQLITQTEVLRYAFTERENVAPGDIRLARIEVAQERFVRPVLGETFYKKLVRGGYPTFTDDYLKPALAHYVRCGIIDDLGVRVTGDGVVVLTSSEHDEQHRTLQRTERAESEGITEGSETATTGSEQTTDREQSLSQTTSSKSSLGTSADSTRTGKETDEAGRSYFENTHESETTAGTTAAEGVQKEGNGSKTGDWQQTGEKDTRTVTSESGSREGEESGSKNVTDSRSDHTTTEKNTTGSSHKTNASSSSKSTGEQFGDNSLSERLRAASPAECRVAAHRALRDANTLMRRALRHLERHPGLYPEYTPRYSLFSSPGLVV